MEDLIKVQVKNDRQLVSARELHKGLKLTTRFSKWVNQNFKDFEKDQDFTSVTTVTDMPRGGVKPIQDYVITIDMAKQLCLLSHTEKGKQYRKYLIEVERKWNDPQEIVKRGYAILQNENTQLKLENKNLGIQLEEANKRASYLDVILGTKDAQTITQIAFDYGYGAPTLNKLLNKYGVQHKVHGQWILYKVYMGKNYTTTHVDQWTDKNGISHAKPRTMWTQKGRKMIYDVLKENGILPLIERDDMK